MLDHIRCFLRHIDHEAAVRCTTHEDKRRGSEIRPGHTCLLAIVKKRHSGGLDRRRQVFFNDRYETDDSSGEIRFAP
ncbi:hypothetical protein GGD40_004721 [Paraburkholderia bryophila]|uniref:Uncharacterized protein n=1 Tax=Paraburkholderia bryophila TaxID=420952 RepID=A0A7Y9WQ73_9BURK|nr:hypothetical protein [Paraburkholderia bryophila]